jgi:hypothetical protein
MAKNRLPLAVFYLIWVLALTAGNWRGGRLHNPWLMGVALLSPMTHIGAFALFSPLPWFLPQRLRSPWNFILGALLSIIASEAVAGLLPLVDYWLCVYGRVPVNLPKVELLYASVVGPALMVIGGLISAHARSETLREASRAEALIAKTRLLQSQIHPHVLFNALNGLAELVHRDAKAAEQAIHHLSDLLRRILRASEATSIPLSEERRMVLDYLAIEAMRLGSRLRVTWEWDPDLDTLEIPPMMLQPLVENAIKHGIAPSIPGGDLVLRALREGDGIAFEVWNSGEPFLATSNGSSIGVRNLLLRPRMVKGCRPGTGGRIKVLVGTNLELMVSRAMTPRTRELIRPL